MSPTGHRGRQDEQKINFKIILKKEDPSTQVNVATCRFKLNVSDEDKFEALKNVVTKKFESFGITRDNFRLYWKEKNGDFTIMADNDDVSMALDELDGPLYELIACLRTEETSWKSAPPLTQYV